MKFASKTMIAAAALAVVGVAQAAPVTGNAGETINWTQGGKTIGVSLTSGSGALSFSPGSTFDGVTPDTIGGLIGALNVGKVTIEGVDGATYSETSIEDEFGDVYRSGATANASVISLTADDVTGQVLSVGSQGGAKQTGTRIGGTLNGGTASVTNLRFDLANNVVYADLVGRSAAVGTSKPAVDYVSLNAALWTIGSVSGPTSLPPSAAFSDNVVADMQAAGYTYVNSVGNTHNFTVTNVISGLKVTEEGFNFFKNSLGLLPTGVGALEKVNDDVLGWGSVSSTLNISITAVPEPSTYAMALMGLAVIGVAARARRKA